MPALQQHAAQAPAAALTTAARAAATAYGPALAPPAESCTCSDVKEPEVYEVLHVHISEILRRLPYDVGDSLCSTCALGFLGQQLMIFKPFIQLLIQ
jgi:hypothetical protein